MTIHGKMNSGLLGMAALTADVAGWNLFADDIGSGMAATGAVLTGLVGARYIFPAMTRLYHKKPGRHAMVGTTGLAALTVALFLAMPGRSAGAETQKNADTQDETIDLRLEPLDSLVYETPKSVVVPNGTASEEKIPRRSIEENLPTLGGLPPQETISPLYRALLDTIAFAEGSDYSTLFGGGKFSGFNRHPRRAVTKWGFTSTAAGRYQFLSSTYDRLKRKGQFQRGFTLEEQDKAALYLIQRSGVTEEMLQNAVASGEFGQVWNTLAGQWASFPRINGKSAYGQRTEQRLTEAYLGFYFVHNR